MSAKAPKIINGKEIAIQIKTEIANKVRKLIDEGKRAPHLAAVLVGDDGASVTYVNNKERTCGEVGFTSSVYRYPASISEKELLDAVQFLNNDPEVDGFIVQLPLPKHIDENKVIESINPVKDVDGFHPINIGKMVLDLPAHLPATPHGIALLLEYCGIETEGKDCVILGRSNIVGRPLSNMLSRKKKTANATITLCHSHTPNITEYTKKADIVVAAIGKPEFLTADMIKEGAVIIDVGIHRIEDNTEKGFHLVGDVKYDEVAAKASAITPVPGGVGPMTIVALLMNTFEAFKNNPAN